MGGRSWTELFFLDEATALAAGHRPCFYCRRDDANRFRAAWEQGNGVTILAPEIDAVLHRERLDGGRKRLHALPMPWTTARRRDAAQEDESYLSRRAGRCGGRRRLSQGRDATKAHAADAAIDIARVVLRL